MKKFFIIMIALLMASGAMAQTDQPCESCLPEGIWFSTQAQIDSFQINYPNCTEILGDVGIYGFDITNLNGLSVLTSIEGFLMINLTAISNLNGLDSLNYIGGTITLDPNPNLVNLSGLEGLTQINGLVIWGLISLESLEGLNNITSAGYIDIIGNPNLTDMQGLNSLTTVGSLEIGTTYWVNGNNSLINLAGLENLISIGFLYIEANDALVDLTGLENVDSIGSLWVNGNNSLINLSGLEGLSTITGDIWIGKGLEFSLGNAQLTSLEALNNVTSVGGDLIITENNALTSLSGLDNIAAGSIDNLSITENDILSTCDVQSICDYLVAPNGAIDIHDNATGCNSQQEVEDDCANNCLPQGITFTTQAQIDSFQVNYPNCTEILGDVFISGNDISNLNGLKVLTAIGGHLYITNNESLVNLKGLDNLITIGDFMWINNVSSLSDLKGLNSLTSIGSYLKIYNNTSLTSLWGLNALSFINGDLRIWDNPSLTHLSALNELDSIAGIISIINNDDLFSLSGIKNISPNSITGIYICNNTALDDCDAHCICEFLAAPNGTVDISNNKMGCNTQQEIENDCADNCLCEGFEFDTQGKIDSFQINYPGCTEIDGHVWIAGYDLTNLEGLIMLTTVGEEFYLYNTEYLTNLSGLNNLVFVGDDLYISGNYGFTSLSGLDNLNYIGGTLTIRHNYELMDIPEWLCDYVSNPNGSIDINSNGFGGLVDLAIQCGGLPCLPYGKYILSGQSAIDNFQLAFPNCTELKGGLFVGGYPSVIYNINGLSSVTSIEEEFSLDGTFVTSLTELDGLTSIGGGITLFMNYYLSTCATEWLCTYLENPNGTVYIYDNATGCNSVEEVEEACLVGVNESAVSSHQSSANIYPNPSNSTITIELPSTTTPNNNTTLTLYNINGQKIIQRQITKPLTTVDVSRYNAGIYFVKVVSVNGVSVGKFIKQ